MAAFTLVSARPTVTASGTASMASEKTDIAVAIRNMSWTLSRMTSSALSAAGASGGSCQPLSMASISSPAVIMRRRFT